MPKKKTHLPCCSTTKTKTKPTTTSKAVAKKIGEGTYGCVYHPALQCDGREVKPTDISKYVQYQEAETQLSEAMNIKQIDPTSEYMMVGEAYMCTPSTVPADCDKNLQNPALLFFPYGGMNFEEFTSNIKPQQVPKMLRNFARLIEGVAKINSNQTFHLDIKDANIVTGRNGNGPYRLIDFGLTIHPPWTNFYPGIFSRYYLYWPVDAILLIESGIPTDSELKAHVNQMYNYPELVWAFDNGLIGGRDSPALRRSKSTIVAMLNDRFDNGIPTNDGFFLIKILEKIDVYSLAVVLLKVAFYNQSKFPPVVLNAVMELFMKSKALHYDSILRCDIDTFLKMYREIVLPLV